MKQLNKRTKKRKRKKNKKSKMEYKYLSMDLLNTNYTIINMLRMSNLLRLSTKLKPISMLRWRLMNSLLLVKTTQN